TQGPGPNPGSEDDQPGDDSDNSGPDTDDNGSLPRTGTSAMMTLATAGVLIALGLTALTYVRRTSRK
ncbi:LPXTG cell wall anchor domain-containing protein, partial [Brevibacterium sp. NPDC049920]